MPAQILADLDAVGNTTKAETKGIAIGSAVIAAVSLFSSFIAVIAVGSEENIHLMTLAQYAEHAGRLTFADPKVFIGMLIGGSVPFLFSGMLIRAVGRAAYFIVKECRIQFRDPEIWAGTKEPDYGRVVNICTATAQKELIGPAILAIMTPLMVGFLLGPYALGGFLAGMILVGQLLAVFMSNAGGAWDNAKKMIEDGIYGGKGSEAHKAAITGDTVGDPLKDTAGPAINPLIKVMNMVSLLALGLVLQYNVVTPSVGGARRDRDPGGRRCHRRHRLGDLAERQRDPVTRRAVTPHGTNNERGAPCAPFTLLFNPEVTVWPSTTSICTWWSFRSTRWWHRSSPRTSSRNITPSAARSIFAAR